MSDDVSIPADRIAKHERAFKASIQLNSELVHLIRDADIHPRMVEVLEEYATAMAELDILDPALWAELMEAAEELKESGEMDT